MPHPAHVPQSRRSPARYGPLHVRSVHWWHAHGGSGCSAVVVAHVPAPDRLRRPQHQVGLPRLRRPAPPLQRCLPSPPHRRQRRRHRSPIASSDATFDVLSIPQPADFVPDISCSETIGSSDPVAIVQLHDATVQQIGEVVLRDYADRKSADRLPLRQDEFTDHPGHRCQAWLSSTRAHTRLSICLMCATTGLTCRSRIHRAAECLCFSRARRSAVDLGRGDFTAATRQIHITTATGDQVVASFPVPLGGRCGSPEDSRRGAYTHTGEERLRAGPANPSHNALMPREHDRDVVPCAGEAGWKAMDSLGDGDVVPGLGDAVLPPGQRRLEIEARDPTRSRPPRGEGTTQSSAPKTATSLMPSRADGLRDVYLVNPDHEPPADRRLPHLPLWNNEQLWYISEGQGCVVPASTSHSSTALMTAEAPSVSTVSSARGRPRARIGLLVRARRLLGQMCHSVRRAHNRGWRTHPTCAVRQPDRERAGVARGTTGTSPPTRDACTATRSRRRASTWAPPELVIGVSPAAESLRRAARRPDACPRQS